MSEWVNDEDKKALILRLRRVEGQLRGIQSMIEGNEECEKIAQQLSAARKALDRAFYVALTSAIEFRLNGGNVDPAVGKQQLEEVTSLLERFA